MTKTTEIEQELWELGWSKLRVAKAGEVYAWQAPTGDTFTDLNEAIAAVHEGVDYLDQAEEDRP